MNNKTISKMPLLMAGLLMVLNRVLLSGIWIAPNGGKIFILYSVVKGFAILGFNLIPLYFGYNYVFFKEKNTMEKLSKLTFVYLAANFILALSLTTVFHTKTLKDFWNFLFPIGQNLYPYGVSIALTFILLPKTIMYLDSLLEKQIKQILCITSVLFVSAPSLFNIDIWSMNAGGKFFLNLYLVILGYSLYRLRLLNNRYMFIKLMAAEIIYALSTWIMSYTTIIVHGNYSTINRFNVGYSIFAIVTSIYLFKWLNSIKISIPSFNAIIVFLITTIVVTYQPISLSIMKTKLFVNRENVTAIVRTLIVIKYYLVILATIILLTEIILLLIKLPYLKKIIKNWTFKSIDELFKKGKQLAYIFRKNKRLCFVMVSFYILTLLQMEIVVATSVKVETINYMYRLFLIHQPAIVLSMLILTIFFYFVYLITNRFWYVYGFVFIVEILLSVSTVLKMQLRNEPVLPTDMGVLKSIGDLLNMISPIVVLVGLIGIFIFILITVILQLKYKRNFDIKLHIKRRLIYIGLLFAILFSLGFVNHKNTIMNRIFETFKISKLFFDQKNGAINNGPLLQFINNIDVSVMEKPNDYSEKKIKSIMKKYNIQAKTINSSRNDWAKDQTMIFVLSESFSDPARVPNLKIDGNPIPNITKIKKNNTSGLMMSSGYGGGTANMEWQSLTGLNLSSLSPTLPTPYSQLVNKLDANPNITNLFDQKIAVHPFNASLYNRIDVFRKFGFQKFYYDGSKDKLKYKNMVPASPYISDSSAYKNVENIISKDENKSQFIQLSTMQNHMPYDKDDSEKSMNFSGSAVGSNTNAVKNYIQRIKYTDSDVKEFLNKLDKMKRPITVVWYGDHLPSIYAGDSMNDYAIPLHQTDYFIYNNVAAKNKIKKNKLISTYSFSAMALQQANIKVTPYYALLTNVTDNVPAAINNPYTTVNNAYNGSQVFILNSSKIEDYSKLTRKQKEIFTDYKLIQYDIVAGKHYSSKWAMQKVK